MANLTGFSIAVGAPQTINNQRTLTLSGKVTDNSGAVLGDFTGANAVTIPQALNTLTAAQAQEFGLLVATFLIAIKFPGTVG